MNQVQQILNSISEDDLKCAIYELVELDSVGVLPPTGVIRRVTQQLCDDVGIVTMMLETLGGHCVYNAPQMEARSIK